KPTPIGRPLVKWRAKPLTLEASEESRSSLHAHPVFRSLGCTSVADAHQTPIWIRCRPVARQGATVSALGSFEPQKVLGTRRRSSEAQYARAHRRATSQSVRDSATRRIEINNRVEQQPGRVISHMVLSQSAN